MLINSIYPSYVTSYGNSYACQSIIEGMIAADVNVRMFCISADKSVSKPLHSFSMPFWAKPIGYKLITPDLWVKYTEWRYQHSFKDQDIAYVWPGTSINTFKGIKSKGNIIVTENINTHQATSKKILDAEYLRLGLIPDHGIDNRAIDDECAKLELVDFVFSPSVEVSKSLKKANVPLEKILQASYGLRPSDILLPEDIEMRPQKKELTAIFVGSLGVRKGVHLLLEYWVKSGVKGKLKLVGRIEPSARHLIEPYLKRGDVEHIPFISDLRSLYRNSDVFLLPSLEEGSPLVTYLALGAGLPSVVSPMGGGGIISDGTDGLVVEPHNAEGWVEAIQKVFSDAEFRITTSRSAYRKAGEYLWSNVGKLRRERLLSSLDNSLPPDLRL